MSRFLLELDGEHHGVRCRAIMPIADAEGAP
jgi:hypothetical protein